MNKKNKQRLQFLIVNRESHLIYFENILKSENVIVLSQCSELVILCKSLYNKVAFLTKDAAKVISQYSECKCRVLIPLDKSNAFDVWFSDSSLRAYNAYGLSAGVLDLEWVFELVSLNRKEKLKNLIPYLAGIYTPDNDLNLNIPIEKVVQSGVFVDQDVNTTSVFEQVLVIPDFADYGCVSEEKWLSDIQGVLSEEKMSFEVLDVKSDNMTFEAFGELKRKLATSLFVITPRSYIHYLARAWSNNAIVYDTDRFVSLSCHRDLAPQAAYVRSRRDLKKAFQSIPQNKLEFLSIPVNAAGRLPETAKLNTPKQYKDHIVIWGRMPAHNYSGGRYHGWLLAEGFAALGYRVTLMTDNRPYFIDDFALFPGHRDIHILTTDDFLEPSTHPSLDARGVLVIPGMDKNGDMYKAAVEYSLSCGARLGLVNFESPNWFNSMVFPNRDPELWKYWGITSKFSNLILSTTQISRKYAEEYYLNIPDDCKFESLYAPINTFAIEQNLSKVEKENRVIVFFPRHGYSAHKGWQNIVDTIGDSFKHHTIVFLCGESDLPAEVTNQLNLLSVEIGFDIEYKIKIDDSQKFEELARACLLLFPSQFEGYGYPPIEALAVGTPVVAFDLPVLRETCSDYLLYAPKGDWDSFKHLANKALQTKFRLSQEAQEHATSIAGFDVFTDKLGHIAKDWLAINDIKNVKPAPCAIDKAFYAVENVVSQFQRIRSKNIQSKAIIKEILYEIQFDKDTDVRVDTTEKVMILVKDSSALGVSLGSNALVDLIRHLKQKNIAADIISQDFAIETLKSEFQFGLNRFISIGTSEREGKAMRGEVGIMLLKMLYQYKYSEVICVDGFLLHEVTHLAKVENCPTVSNLELRVRNKDWKSNVIRRTYAAVNNGYNSKTARCIVPDSLLISRKRTEWLVNGRTNNLTIFIENIDASSIRFISSFESILQKLQDSDVSLTLRVATTEPTDALPYFVDNVVYKNNDDLYRLTKQSMFSINLLETELTEYLSKLASLVGTIEISTTLDLNDLIEAIVSLCLNVEVWSKVRRENFNKEVNLVASSDYFNGVLDKYNREAHSNFLTKYEFSKHSFFNDFESQQPALFELFKKKLNMGMLLQATEIIKRYTLVSEDKLTSICVLIKLLNLARQPKAAEKYYIEIRKRYPFESLIFIIGSEIKFKFNELTSASQLDYYSLMLDSLSIESILAAARASIKVNREIDNDIYKMIIKNGLNSGNSKQKFNCERQSRLFKGLVREYEDNGNN